MIRIEPFSYQLRRPTKAYAQTLTETHGFYLEYKATKTECMTWSKNLLPELQKELLNHESFFLKALDQQISVWDFQVPSRFPNVRFAYASLLQALQSPPKNPKILVNGLLNAKDPDVTEKAYELSQCGVQIVKLKVTPQDRAEVLNLQSKISFRWRLDGNLAFTLEDAVSFCTDLNGVEYFEEPLSTPQLLETFFEKSAIPYALDENKELISNSLKGVRALIIKPSLLGDFSDLKQFIGKAPIIISSSYESDVGLKNLMNWAYFVNPSEHHGLFTFDIFKTPSSLIVQDGQIYEK
jgi:o-succinylbenzoate synthase